MLDTIPFTSVIINLEHGLAILTESFSPLRSVLHNLSCWSPKQKCTLSYAIPFYTMCQGTFRNSHPPADLNALGPGYEVRPDLVTIP